MPSISVDPAWRAVLSRDRRSDGWFVYAVSSTRVYCRPSCPSRRPSRNHVTFFDSPQLAESVGYRACLRCRPQSVAGSEAEERVERARSYLDDHADEPITLRQLAVHVGLSPFHIQRAFTKMVGLSPKAYQNTKRMERFTASLKRGETITTATYEAGFGSSSRLYARVHEDLGMTPSAFCSGGMGVTLRYTTVPTVVGRMLVAVTERDIAAVSLGETEVALVASLRSDYPRAVLRRDRKGLEKPIPRLLNCLSGSVSMDCLSLDVKAGLSTQGVAGSARDPSRTDPVLSRGCSGDRAADGSAGCGQSLCGQSPRSRHPLSSSRTRQWTACRLSLGSGAEATASCAGTNVSRRHRLILRFSDSNFLLVIPRNPCPLSKCASVLPCGNR